MPAEGCEADPPTTKLTDAGARPGTRAPAPRPSRAAVAIDHGLVTMPQTPTTTPSGTSAGEALAPLVQEALASRGVHHPFLRRFASGDLPDPAAALRAYAWEYSGYSAWFPRYLKAVIGRLSSAEHKERLSHNLQEEQGLLDGDDCAELRRLGIDPSTVRGVPHPQLFARFCRAVGLEGKALRSPSPAARAWRERFERYLDEATAAQAVGALGLGTEHVVKPIYEQLLEGIRRQGDLRRQDYVFFELHCLVDDQHQQDLLDIAADLAAEPGGLAGLRQGMLTALRLRCQFWDHLLRTADGAQEQQA